MQRRRASTWTALAIAGAVVLQAGCGGGPDFGDVGSFDQIDDPDAPFGDAVDSDDDSGFGGVPGPVAAGPVTVSAEPGHAVVTVDGRTIDHTAANSGRRFSCRFSDEQIDLDVDSGVGLMVLGATRTDDGWIGRFTADSDEGGDDWIQYSAQPFDGELGIDLEAQTLSYVGTAFRQNRTAMADGDMDTPTVEVTVAVNCGIEPATLVVGGETFTFPLFAADSNTCQFTPPDSVEVRINYTMMENRRLSFDVRPDGDGVIGGVHVQEGDDRWSSVFTTGDGTADGLSFDGSTVRFTGTFEHTSDTDPDLSEQVEGTAVVTCPT